MSCADAGIVELDMNDPLHPKLVAVIPIARRPVDGAAIPLSVRRRRGRARRCRRHRPGAPRGGPAGASAARRRPAGLCLAHLRLCRRRKRRARDRRCRAARTAAALSMYTAGGRLNDARDVVVGATNASLFAYVADGVNGLKVIQLISPESQPNFYGFAPDPKPELIAWYQTASPALVLVARARTRPRRRRDRQPDRGLRPHRLAPLHP